MENSRNDFGKLNEKIKNAQRYAGMYPTKVALTGSNSVRIKNTMTATTENTGNSRGCLLILQR